MEKSLESISWDSIHSALECRSFVFDIGSFVERREACGKAEVTSVLSIMKIIFQNLRIDLLVLNTATHIPLRYPMSVGNMVYH